MNNFELQPCPFCGEYPRFREWKDRALVDLVHVCRWANFISTNFPVALPKSVEEWNVRAVYGFELLEMIYTLEEPYQGYPKGTQVKILSRNPLTLEIEGKKFEEEVSIRLLGPDEEIYRFYGSEAKHH